MIGRDDNPRFVTRQDLYWICKMNGLTPIYARAFSTSQQYNNQYLSE